MKDRACTNHVPFLLDRSRGPCGTLIGHVSRANSVWRELDSARPSVVMSQGPRAYITPGWYPGKAEHGEVVPTWNYVVAHAHGVARAVEDRDWVFDMLRRLTARHEAPRPVPWSVSDAPAPMGVSMSTMARIILSMNDRVLNKRRHGARRVAGLLTQPAHGPEAVGHRFVLAGYELALEAIDSDAADSP